MNDSPRTALLTQRSKLNSRDVQEASQSIIFQLIGLDIYQAAEHVLLYRAVGGEIDLQGLYQQALTDKKACLFPVITNYQQKRMGFMRCDQDTVWRENRYGIAEPVIDPDKWLQDGVTCLLLTPLVGFRADCHRLGMGAGFYDRWIASREPRPTCVGVAYEFQRCEDIQVADWDQALHGVVTPTQQFWSSTLPLPGRVNS